MNEKVKQFWKRLGVTLLQALAVLLVGFAGLWLFGAFVIFWALSRA